MMLIKLVFAQNLSTITLILPGYLNFTINQHAVTLIKCSRIELKSYLIGLIISRHDPYSIYLPLRWYFFFFFLIYNLEHIICIFTMVYRGQYSTYTIRHGVSTDIYIMVCCAAVVCYWDNIASARGRKSFLNDNLCIYCHDVCVCYTNILFVHVQLLTA